MRLTLLLLLSLTTAFGAEKKFELGQFSPGKQVSGARVTAASQKDKGTVYVFWLYKTQKARDGEALKLCQKIAEKHKDALLVASVDNTPSYASMKLPSNKEMSELIKSAGVTHPVFSGCKSPFEITSHPSIFIFDRKGRMLYGGLMPESEELDSLLKKATAATGSK